MRAAPGSVCRFLCLSLAIFLLGLLWVKRRSASDTYSLVTERLPLTVTDSSGERVADRQLLQEAHVVMTHESQVVLAGPLEGYELLPDRLHKLSSPGWRDGLELPEASSTSLSLRFPITARHKSPTTPTKESTDQETYDPVLNNQKLRLLRIADLGAPQDLLYLTRDTTEHALAGPLLRVPRRDNSGTQEVVLRDVRDLLMVQGLLTAVTSRQLVLLGCTEGLLEPTPEQARTMEDEKILLNSAVQLPSGPVLLGTTRGLWRCAEIHNGSKCSPSLVSPLTVGNGPAEISQLLIAGGRVLGRDQEGVFEILPERELKLAVPGWLATWGLVPMRQVRQLKALYAPGGGSQGKALETRDVQVLLRPSHCALAGRDYPAPDGGPWQNPNELLAFLELPGSKEEAELVKQRNTSCVWRPLGSLKAEELPSHLAQIDVLLWDSMNGNWRLEREIRVHDWLAWLEFLAKVLAAFALVVVAVRLSAIRSGPRSIALSHLLAWLFGQDSLHKTYAACPWLRSAALRKLKRELAEAVKPPQEMQAALESLVSTLQGSSRPAIRVAALGWLSTEGQRQQDLECLARGISSAENSSCHALPILSPTAKPDTTPTERANALLEAARQVLRAVGGIQSPDSLDALVTGPGLVFLLSPPLTEGKAAEPTIWPNLTKFKCMPDPTPKGSKPSRGSSLETAAWSWSVPGMS